MDDLPCASCAVVRIAAETFGVDNEGSPIRGGVVVRPGCVHLQPALRNAWVFEIRPRESWFDLAGLRVRLYDVTVEGDAGRGDEPLAPA
jgi:hypothetical protein